MKPVVEVVTAAYPSPAEPHRAHFVESLVAALSEDFDLEVIAPRIYPDDPLLEERKGVPVRRFRFSSGGKILKARKHVPFLVKAEYAASAFALAKQRIFSRRASLVFGHWAIPAGSVAAAAARLLFRPFVLMVHGSDIHDYAERSLVLKTAARFAVRSAKHVFAASGDLAERVVGEYSKPADAVSVAPSGVGEHFRTAPSRDDARVKLSLPEDARVVCFIGDLVPEKGVQELAAAAERIMQARTDVHFIIIGDGPLLDRLAQHFEKAGLLPRFILAGRVLNADVPSYLAASDIFCLPSHGEGTPISVMEALTVGRPVVASNVGGIPDIVEDGETGMLVPPKSAEALADSLEKLLDDDGLRRRMTENTESLRHDFSIGRQADSVRKVLNNLVQQRR
ncbi:MAG: glycosyltransferase family 4 protein [Planctomycetota bacterium]|nr:MAG: glycosyltransferase family 4 protein [Planctomycetota bacterium]